MESVSLKLSKLQQLEEDLTKAISARVNKLRDECQKSPANDPHGVNTNVTSRIDCLSEFLQNILSQVQDCGQQVESDKETTRGLSADELSLGERMNKLEEAVKSCLEPNQCLRIEPLQVREDSLASHTDLQTCVSKGGNESETYLKTELRDLRLLVERVDQDRKAMEDRLKQLEMVNEDRLEIRDQVKKDIERVDEEMKEMKMEQKLEVETLSKEKKEKELYLLVELKRMDEERVANETQLKREIETIDKDRLIMENNLRETIERVGKERLCVESDLRDYLGRVEKERMDAESQLKNQLDRVDKERSRMEAYLSEELHRLDKERRAIRIKMRGMVSKQKTSQRQFQEMRTEEKQYCTVLAKQVKSLEDWNHGLDQDIRDISKKTSKFQGLVEVLNELKQKSMKQPNTLEMVREAQKNINFLNAWLEDLDVRFHRNTGLLVGFSAKLKGLREIGPWNAVVDQLLDVASNIGNCFNPKEGEFVVPHDGLYGFCVKIDQMTSVAFKVYIMSKVTDGNERKEMEVPMYKDVPHSAFCLLDLKKDRRVCVVVAEARQQVKLCSTFTFSGWSIAYH